MTAQPPHQPGGSDTATEVSPGEWPAWCADASARHRGRKLILHVADDALGHVRLAEGQPFVAVEHDTVGPNVALTIKYGAGVVPVRYVTAEPQEVLQHRDDSGQVQEATIVDSTGRRTFVSLV